MCDPDNQHVGVGVTWSITPSRELTICVSKVHSQGHISDPVGIHIHVGVVQLSLLQAQPQLGKNAALEDNIPHGGDPLEGMRWGGVSGCGLAWPLNIAEHHVLVTLATADHSTLAIAHQHHRWAGVQVVVAGHGRAVGTRGRDGNDISRLTSR